MPTIEPTVTQNSPLFEMREWRRELDKLRVQHGEDEAAFLDGLAQYRKFEQKFARQEELSRLNHDQS